MTQAPKTSSMCWWCGNAANSREHRAKRTDLVNLFGSGAWRGSVVHGVDDTLRKPQSATSQGFKFAASLCSSCNNARSQPFDKAYETFIAYYDAHEGDIEISRVLDLAEIFGGNWQQEQVNLARYLVKHVGCRVADAGRPVPTEFATYLDSGAPWPDSLTIVMVFRSDTWELNKHTVDVHQNETRGIFIGPMDAMVSRDSGRIIEVDSHYLYASLGFHWRIDTEGSGGINFSGPLVSLPEFSAIDPSEISENCKTCNLGQ